MLMPRSAGAMVLVSCCEEPVRSHDTVASFSKLGLNVNVSFTTTCLVSSMKFSVI